MCVICDRGRLNEERNGLSDDSDSDESGAAIIAQLIVDTISHGTVTQDAMYVESVQIYQQFEAGDVAGAMARWEVMLAEARTLDWSSYEGDFVTELVDDLNHAIHIGELGMPYVYRSDGSSDSDSE